MNKGGLPDFRGRDEAISRVWQVCLFACTGLSFGMQLCGHTHKPANASERSKTCFHERT